MEILAGIHDRRSLRQFAAKPLPPELLRQALAAACTAPAPHHTRPWRFVTIGLGENRERLASAMGDRWRRDLAADGVPAGEIAELLDRSRQRIAAAPSLILACLVAEGLRRWPDGGRNASEWHMAVQSLGAALQNLMLAAHGLGIASYWISAPLFCPDVVREALQLPEGIFPQALIAMGYPAAGARPALRPPLDLDRFLLER